MLDFLVSTQLGEGRLLRFLESRINFGLMLRRFGEDEMIWSRGMYALLDLDPHEDKPSFHLLQRMKHPDDRLTFEQVEDGFQAAKSLSRSYRVIRRDGTLRYLSQQAEVLVDVSGRPEKILSVVTDVTGLESIRKTSQTTARRLKAFSEHSGVMLILVRPDGYVTRIMAYTRADEQEQSRRYGFDWKALVHPDDREESLAVFQTAAHQKTAVTREHRVLQADGSYRWRRARWLPVFDEQSELVEFIVMSQDIEDEINPAARSITGAQIRAARGLLRWSVQKLAEEAGVGAALIRRFEEFDGVPKNDATALREVADALSQAGAEFLWPHARKPGVGLK